MRLGLIAAMRKRRSRADFQRAIARTSAEKHRPSLIADCASYVLCANCANARSGAYCTKCLWNLSLPADNALSQCASFFTNLLRPMTFVGARRRASCEKAHDVRVHALIESKPSWIESH